MLLAPDRRRPAVGGGGDVDVVHAGAGARDDAEPGRGGEQAGVHPGGAAHEQRIGVGHVREEHLDRPAGSRVHFPAGLTAEERHRRSRQVVRDDDLQCDFAGPMLRT